MSISFKIFKQKPLVWLYVGGSLLLIIGGVLWCYKVSTSPEHVFWATVKQSLTARGVTVTADQTNSGTTLHEVIQFSLGVNNLSHSLTTLSRQGTVVRSEAIGTPTVDYTRYVGIKTDQKRSDGKALDFAPVVGVWTKSPDGSNQQFGQALLGTSLPLGGIGIPIGYVSSDMRASLLKQIHSDGVYQVSFKSVKKTHQNGRTLYTYSVSLQPVAYVALIKQFSKDLGLHQLDQLDPKAYVGQKALEMSITIDARAHHVVLAALPTGGAKQAYGSYDVPANPALPKHTISSTELQTLLTKVQQ